MGKFQKKIYLKAYYRGNLGDDMFVRHVSARYPNILFKICTSAKYASAFKDCTNVKNISCAGSILDRIVNKLFGKHIVNQFVEKSSAATVHIGGSIFIEPENFSAPKNGVAVNKNLFIIGSNFGPYKTEGYRNFVKSKLQKATDICFRDSYSYNEFADIEHARVAPDVLFGYFDFPAVQKGRGVGISVIDLSWRPDLKYMSDAYYKGIAHTVDRFVREGLPVKLFSFCEDEGDTKAIRRVLEYAESQKEIEVCLYEGNIDNILRKMNDCEYILASRFHAMIIGWAMHKKVYPIIYSLKQIHVIEDVNFEGSMWNLLAGDIPSSNQIMDDCFNISDEFNVAEYVFRSEEQFKGFDGFLSSEK